MDDPREEIRENIQAKKSIGVDGWQIDEQSEVVVQDWMQQPNLTTTSDPSQHDADGDDAAQGDSIKALGPTPSNT